MSRDLAILAGCAVGHSGTPLGGAEVAGFMRLKPQPKGVLLDRLAVCPAFRRRGIGASLVHWRKKSHMQA